MVYRREIDGLRGLAVLSVILFHAGIQIVSGGFVGVDVFFVISGYLITTIILHEKQEGTFTLTGFYERRARRILPALFVVMFVCLPFAWLLMIPDEMQDFSQSLVAVSVYLSNFLFWKESGYFDTAVEYKPLLHTWSLAVEEQYYLFFPIFLLLTWRLGKRWIIGLLSLIAVISLGLAQWGSANQPEAAFYLLPTRGWELLVGAFIAFYLLETKQNHSFAEKNQIINQILSFFGILLILYAVFAFDKNTPFPSVYTLIPTLGAALIILFTAPKTIAWMVLNSKLFVGVGLVSYSAYLWHQPLFAFSRLGFFEDKINGYLIGIVFFLSYFSWKYVEKPIRNRSLLTNRKAFLWAVIVCSAFFISFGMWGHTSKGFKRFFDKNNLVELAKINAIGRERGKLIRGGACHFNNLAKSGLDDFLAQWDCFTDSALPNLQKIPLIITGDSHSADKVMALKQNGYVPLQIGGANCSLNPNFMTKQCKLIFEKLYQVSVHDEYYKYIAIANSFSKEELSIESLRQTIDYWNRFGKKIIFFTAMPDFLQFKTSVVRSRPLRADYEFAKLSEESNVTRYLEYRGVHIINTRQIFCSIGLNCSYKDSYGELLLTDQSHLSRVGAKHFGEQLLKQDSLLKTIVDQNIAHSDLSGNQ
jgi:peptidoglycan/LPS O-acetylase OafA/YrhL